MLHKRKKRIAGLGNPFWVICFKIYYLCCINNYTIKSLSFKKSGTEICGIMGIRRKRKLPAIPVIAMPAMTDRFLCSGVKSSARNKIMATAFIILILLCSVFLVFIWNSFHWNLCKKGTAISGLDTQFLSFSDLRKRLLPTGSVTRWFWEAMQ